MVRLRTGRAGTKSFRISKRPDSRSLQSRTRSTRWTTTSPPPGGRSGMRKVLSSWSAIHGLAPSSRKRETTKKVKSLVYVAAYAPDKGESVHSACSKYPDPESLKTFVKDSDGYLTISEEGIRRYFAADLSPEEQSVVAATQGPFHIRTLTAPMSQVAWREKPTFMVVATKDTIIPPQMERDQAKAAKATAIEVPSSHVAMLSFPKEVAELIIKAAE